MRARSMRRRIRPTRPVSAAARARSTRVRPARRAAAATSSSDTPYRRPGGAKCGPRSPELSAERAIASLHRAVRDVCLWLPEAEEFLSHGSPNFRVCGKTFATYVVNHHGDGRVALWLPAPRGAQEHHLRASPGHFFVPPYVGVRGWLGVHLDRGLAWKRVAELVREAYLHVAPRRLRLSVGAIPSIAAPRK